MGDYRAVNWYAPTSNLKLMFDRLVCMNGGNPREDLIEHKDAELAMKLEHSPEWEKLSRNLESGSNMEQMTEAIHMASALRGGAALIHGLQAHNSVDKVSM